MKQRELFLVDHPMPHLTSDTQVKVQSLEVGICGTDKEICTFVYGEPPPGDNYLVLGHESLGQVIEVGSKVKHLKVGDLVVPSVRRPCDDPTCQPCRASLQDFCQTGNFVERGIKMRHGYMTEFYVEDERYLNHVPPDLRDVAVLVEPLTVAEKGIAQLWQVQKRLPWVRQDAPADQPGKGLNAVVLGAGPIGILGAMALKIRGFNTFVYSRSKKPNFKAELVESFGVKYISTLTHTPAQMAAEIGNIDVIYEGNGNSGNAFETLEVLGVNGCLIFTGIPAPGDRISVNGNQLMRNIVLKNQAIVGTVNADRPAFENAIADLGAFKRRWPHAIQKVITGRHRIDAFRDLLGEEKNGIKNIISLA